MNELNYTPAQALVILHALVNSGVLTHGAVKTTHRMLLEQSMTMSRVLSENGIDGKVKRARRGKKDPRRVLVGKYMGYMRHLKPVQRAAVKAVREEHGMRVAIKHAKELAKEKAEA